MKPYVEINADTKRISDEVIDYVFKQRTGINLYNGHPWKFIDIKSLLKQSPTLVKFFKQHGLRVKHGAITSIFTNKDLPMHVDEKPVVAKINFPILNTKGWTNKWYSVEKISTYPTVKNQIGSEVYDLSTAKGELLTEYRDMPNPIVFNSSIPHSVEQYAEDAKTPRVIASFTFIEEPIEWLK